MEDSVLRTHLRLLYQSQKDTLLWLREVGDRLQSVAVAARSAEESVPQGLREALDAMDEFLDRPPVSDLALEAIQGLINDLGPSA